MKRLVIIILAFWAMNPAHAAESPMIELWADLPKQCAGWELSSVIEFSKNASAWEVRERASQENLVHFYKNICPSYLGSANGAASVGSDPSKMTLEKFTKELRRAYSDIGQVKLEAEKNKKYLDSMIEKLGSFFATGGFKLEDHPCGARFIERRKFIPTLTGVCASIDLRYF